MYYLKFNALEIVSCTAPNYDMDNEMPAHKGINWYAKQILKKMGVL